MLNYMYYAVECAAIKGANQTTFMRRLVCFVIVYINTIRFSRDEAHKLLKLHAHVLSNFIFTNV